VTATVQVAEWGRLGLGWRESGQASLGGPLLRLAQDLDRAFGLLATAAWGAQEERHPASLPAERLQRVDYLHSFPHQASFPVRLDPEEENLDRFRSGPMVGGDGRVRLTGLAPVSEVLTPAACYHVYAAHEGESLPGPLYLTTANTCFRHEARYEPLRRQWSFTMREIVCLGTAAETAGFIETGRSAVDLLLRQLDIETHWSAATDPFFRPLENPKYLMQRLQPTKHEAVYGGDLAISSANLHHEHFGAGFSITRDERPAHSACLAFGIERWLFAVTDRHGISPCAWPDPVAAARQVAGSQAGPRS
jgi:seryl-tRNA synthetase